MTRRPRRAAKRFFAHWVLRPIKAVWRVIWRCTKRFGRLLRRSVPEFLGIVAVAVPLFAASWTGLKATRLGQPDFGWIDLIPTFL